VRSPTRARPRVDLRSRPDAILVLGAAAVAFIAIWTGIKITAVVLDETVYKYAAARYTEGLSNIVNDDTSRGIARLYSVLIAPAFALFDGDVAVRIARALNGVVFAATAIPVAARGGWAGATRTAAAAAGVLSVAVPWLTLATILFSESLAYLLFACVVLAMLRALERPGIGREALVLGLLGALVVGATGAVTALGDTLFPAGSLAEGIQQDFSPTAHFLLQLRIYHPALAVLAGAYTIFAGALAAARRPGRSTRLFARALAAIFLAQIAIGVANIVLLAPIFMQLIHLLMADLVWLTLVLAAATALAAPSPAVAAKPMAEPAPAAR